MASTALTWNRHSLTYAHKAFSNHGARYLIHKNTYPARFHARSLTTIFLNKPIGDNDFANLPKNFKPNLEAPRFDMTTDGQKR